MASLRINFPEKDQPSTIALRGDRITIGRRPDNTLQILDRTVSAFHAELILEDGHYRLHDLGSANGTYVNGDAVTDYHLRENCKIAFGTLECEFDSVELEQAPEGLPTHAELASLLKNNEELKAQLDTVRTELAALRTESPLSEAGTNSVPREEFEKVVLDRASLSERLHRSEAELLKLREEIAILRRDRENLERAAESARQEVARVRSGTGGAMSAVAAATVKHDPERSAGPSVVGMPKSVGIPSSSAAPKATPAQAPAPTAAPAMPSPAVKSTPAAPTSAPGFPSPAVLPRPAPAPSAATSNPIPRTMPVAASAPTNPATPGVGVTPTPTVRQAPPAGILPGATPRAVPAATPAAARPAPNGPAGTQKISMPEAPSPNSGATKVSPVAAKMPMKPYVRPAVGSAVSSNANTGAKPVSTRDPRLHPEPEEQHEA
jgi:predicted component of type VI protein secretion system